MSNPKVFASTEVLNPSFCDADSSPTDDTMMMIDIERQHLEVLAVKRQWEEEPSSVTDALSLLPDNAINDEMLGEDTTADFQCNHPDETNLDQEATIPAVLEDITMNEKMDAMENAAMDEKNMIHSDVIVTDKIHKEDTSNNEIHVDQQAIVLLDTTTIENDNRYDATIRDDEIGLLDVLNIKGNRSNTHEGNMAYRELVEPHRAAYRSLKKTRDKQMFAFGLVTEWRNHGGRFLAPHKKDDKGKVVSWYDIGNDAMMKKTQQLCRE